MRICDFHRHARTADVRGPSTLNLQFQLTLTTCARVLINPYDFSEVSIIRKIKCRNIINSEKSPSSIQNLKPLPSLLCLNVTARCGLIPVKDPHFTIARQWLSGQSIPLDHGGSWVQIPYGTGIFFRADAISTYYTDFTGAC